MTLRVERVQGCGLLLVLEEGEGWGKKKGIVGVATMPCCYKREMVYSTVISCRDFIGCTRF